MLERLKHTARVIRSKPEKPSQRWPFTPEPSRGYGLKIPPEQNPAVRFIEMAIIVCLITFVVDPIIRWLFSPAAGVQTSLNVVGSVLLYQGIQRLEPHLSASLHLNLSFLNPYFGHRLRETGRILKGETSERKAPAR